MSEKQLQTFLKYLELYRYGENEFAYSLFVDRSFKYAELAMIDSFTKKQIQHAPIFSCICLDKQTASMCIFDLDTLFNLMFPTNDDKKNFEVNINAQKAICPSCGEELAFNYLVFDPFLMKFHKFVQTIRNEQVIMKMEAIRNSDKIKYSLFAPKNRANEFSGELVLTPKISTFSIDQYSRMQSELDREISQLKEDKKTKEGVEEEISIRHAVQTILLDQQQQQEMKPGDTTKIEKEIQFRVLKVGGSNGQHFLSMKNRKMIYLENDKLFMSLPSLSFSRKLLIYELSILLQDGTTSCMESEEFQERKCLLVYDSVVLVITKSKVYSIQLASLAEGELTLEEIFTFEVSFTYMPQVCFLGGDLFLMDLTSSKETVKVRLVKDILIYPVEQSICQPEIFLEISEISQREKVVLLGNEHAGEIVIITPDQLFRFDLKNDSWKESDILNQPDEIDQNLDDSSMTNYERQALDKLFINPMDIIAINTSGEEFLLFSTQNDLFVRFTLGDPCCFIDVEGLMNPNRVSDNIIVDEQHLYYIIKTPKYIDDSEEQQELLNQFEEQCRIISEYSQESILAAEKTIVNPNNLKFCSNLAVYSMSLPF